MSKIRREFVHGSYSKSKENFNSDIILVKEYLHHEDGTVVPNLRIVKDYQRPWYTTKRECRDHEQKKEWEYIERLDEHWSTQAEMLNKVKRVLNLWQERGIRDCGNSPYLYGTDISSVSMLAKEYMDREPLLFTPSSYAVLDFETDIINDENMPVSCVLSMKKKAVFVMDRNFFKGKCNLPEDDASLIKLIKECVDRLIGDEVKKRECEIEYLMVDNGGEVVVEAMRKAHEWKPDYIGVWNIGADMKFMLHALNTYGIDPEWVFTDPCVPREYRRFYYRKDEARKEKADGTAISKHHADLWHHIETMASFKFVDAMVTFKHQRTRDGLRNSYSLKSVLEDYTDVRKFEFEECAGLPSFEYHVKMQRDYPIEYMAYMGMDGFGPETLEENERDITEKLRASLKWTELHNMKSNPKFLADTFYYVLKEQGKIQTCTGSEMDSHIDSNTPSPREWILALAADLEKDMGVSLLEEFPGLPSSAVCHSMDSDLASCYPMGDLIANAGKTTTRIEVCCVVGEDETRTRAAGINLTGGRVNALEICTLMFNYPSPEEVLEAALMDEEFINAV